ncbi:unnamed protein product [marine sediment metagenome]|uniref:Uncharacterized protein n=1 Tax=marine sediment metagenome TaxID=412755 RepID=X1UCJ1_9ZZZZ
MRGIAWRPTGWFIGICEPPHTPFIIRKFYNRPFGDVLVMVGLVFWVVGIWFSEAWPFIRKE